MDHLFHKATTGGEGCGRESSFVIARSICRSRIPEETIEDDSVTPVGSLVKEIFDSSSPCEGSDVV
jgi:hypothetical protein